MKVLNDNVLVGDIETMTKKAGDIFLPDKGMLYGEHGDNSGRRYEPEVGTVMGIGPKALNLAVGDRVYLAPLKGKEYKDMKIYKYEEIFGKIVDEKIDCQHDWKEGLDRNGGRIYYCPKCNYNTKELM